MEVNQSIKRGTMYAMLGLFFYPLFLNILGFFSPIIAHLFYGQEANLHSYDILYIGQLFIPVFFLPYIISVFYLMPNRTMIPQFKWLKPLLAVLVIVFLIGQLAIVVSKYFKFENVDYIRWGAFIAYSLSALAGLFLLERLLRYFKRNKFAIYLYFIMGLSVLSDLFSETIYQKIETLTPNFHFIYAMLTLTIAFLLGFSALFALLKIRKSCSTA